MSASTVRNAAVESADRGVVPGPDAAFPHRLVEQVVRGAQDDARLDDAWCAVDRLVAWAEAQRLHVIGRLRSRGRSPFEFVDGASVHGSMASVARAERRAEAAARFPTFLAALERGDISVAHLDRLAEALRRLLPHERDQLVADQERLVVIAARSGASRFARVLAREVARLEHLRPAPAGNGGDPDDSGAPDDSGRHGDPGERRFASQQAGVRCSSHVDRDTGMTVYRLLLDPLRALSLDRRVAAVVEALHHGPPIQGCPTDALERQAFLRAHALLLLLDGQAGRRPAGAEVIVVVDHTTPDRVPDVDWGRPIDIPARVLDDLLGAPGTRQTEIVVRNGVVISAPGSLDLGRSTRLANGHQRRALRALYRGCAMPGCDTGFDLCTIHHVRWWRHGGTTDLANLLPLCNRHHHLVHDSGWQLHLGPNRELTVTTPSGRTMSTGPPRRWAA